MRIRLNRRKSARCPDENFYSKNQAGAGVIRKIGKGVSNLPDYESYVAHIKIHHPEVAPPTEAEFFNDFLDKNTEHPPGDAVKKRESA